MWRGIAAIYIYIFTIPCDEKRALCDWLSCKSKTDWLIVRRCWRSYKRNAHPHSLASSLRTWSGEHARSHAFHIDGIWRIAFRSLAVCRSANRRILAFSCTSHLPFGFRHFFRCFLSPPHGLYHLFAMKISFCCCCCHNSGSKSSGVRDEFNSTKWSACSTTAQLSPRPVDRWCARYHRCVDGGLK